MKGLVIVPILSLVEFYTDGEIGHLVDLLEKFRSESIIRNVTG
jgi:hypothetical protein